MSTQNTTEVEGDGRTEAEITEHVEPREQGGAAYVRCEGCGWELLCSLGGADALPHADDCPTNGGGN